jgi:hypothetical protein
LKVWGVKLRVFEDQGGISKRVEVQGGSLKFPLKFFFLFVTMLLIGHDLHRNYELHVIGLFNLFEHCLSLEIPIFDSCVGLERLHLFD